MKLYSCKSTQHICYWGSYWGTASNFLCNHDDFCFHLRWWLSNKVKPYNNVHTNDLIIKTLVYQHEVISLWLVSWVLAAGRWYLDCLQKELSKTANNFKFLTHKQANFIWALSICCQTQNLFNVSSFNLLPFQVIT